ncbi:hypothetical protein HKD37_20G055377 [Glycine soja]
MNNASLTINENYDSDVRDDTETFLNRIVPEGQMTCQLILNHRCLVVHSRYPLQMVYGSVNIGIILPHEELLSHLMKYEVLRSGKLHQHPLRFNKVTLIHDALPIFNLYKPPSI